MLNRNPLIKIDNQGADVACPAYLGTFRIGCKADVTLAALGVVARRKVVRV